LKEINLNEILQGVQKPARYTGGEYNSVRKNWDDGKVRVCLSYPEIYEIGMSYLGLQILYHLLNEREDCLCERVFAPWTDMEANLKAQHVELFSLESYKSIREFDVLGFTLGYELTYTNVLNIMKLGNIDILSAQRGDDQPIVIAGGPCAVNPLPMSKFIDIFFIGDGEESLAEFIKLVGESKRSGLKRREIILKAASIEGAYVPMKGNPVKKRIVEDLESAFYPVKMIVPFIRTVHDRVAIEVMRGCPNFCRFCQARAIYHPVRIRSAEKVIGLSRESLKQTGYEEISFLSLSSSNYPYLVKVLDEVSKEFAGKGVNVSVPSLRIEDYCDDIPQIISRSRKTGLTFAPEAGSEKLRNIMNKKIDTELLFKACVNAFKRGWRHVKLYFMIGLPGETDDDLQAIADMAFKISELGREIDGRRREVVLSVNAFVPKPHTPFQYFPMCSYEEIKRKQAFLKQILSRSNKIKMDYQDVSVSMLEASLARGDISTGDVIEAAWSSGAKFDGWREHFKKAIWEEAFISKQGVSFYDKACSGFDPDSGTPWGFVDIGRTMDTVRKEYEDIQQAVRDSVKRP